MMKFLFAYEGSRCVGRFEANCMAKSGTSSLLSSSCTYGTSYLKFLVYWSGLHQSPWPSCTITQARAIINSVREMGKVSEVGDG